MREMLHPHNLRKGVHAMERVDQYWESVREKVCAHCIDSDGFGNCRLPGAQECAVKLYFPRILETVLTVKSGRITPYVEALRRTVCAECRYQSAEGNCVLRDRIDCGLDRYFPLVVEAIEETASSLKSQQKMS